MRKRKVQYGMRILRLKNLLASKKTMLIIWLVFAFSFVTCHPLEIECKAACKEQGKNY